jgi:hypothetical protein
MRTRVLAALVVALTAAVLTGCSGSSSPVATTAAASTTASEPPPWGLDAVALPSTQREIEALLEAMPAEVAGLPKQPVSANEAAYGDAGMGQMSGSMETFLRVMDLGGSAGNEYGTAAPFIGALVDNGDIGNEGASLETDGPIVWAAGHTAGSTDYYSVMWGEPDSRYVFLIEGTSEAERLALIEAFTAAATPVS